MAETQLISQLKFRVGSLQSALSDRIRELQGLKGVETQADSKIKGLTKIHNDKVKSLLNSIQILKKQKAGLENLSKQHKRSKLIQHLNKQILDQDLVIDILRKFVYDDKGHAEGRKICDQIIVKALTKGPERIRAVTRQELRMQIQKLKANSFSKAKGSALEATGKGGKEFGEESIISQTSEKDEVNQNQQIFKKLRGLQTQNQGLKIQISTKGKIIEKLKSEAKEKDRLKAQVQLLTNQVEISGRKVLAFDRLLRETKENMHIKISELYERELKVEELEMNSRQDGERIRQAHESTNILIEEMRQEKEQIRVELELLKKQNEALMLDKMSMKNRHQEQNKKIVEIRQINSGFKEELADKVKAMTAELQRLSEENANLSNLLRTSEANYFHQRQQWVEERSKLLQELAAGNGNGGVSTNQGNMEFSQIQEVDRLRKENRDLKELMESGTGTSTDNKILLARLQNYRMRQELYDSKDGKSRERQMYDQLFHKYNDLLTEYQNLKKSGPSASKLKSKKLNIIGVTPKEEEKIKDISSGISRLDLEDIDSDILDNFDSSYEYELRVDQVDRQKFKGVPKLTQEDQELLKLLSSDLWDFVQDNRVQFKIDEAIAVSQRQDNEQDLLMADRIRKIKNISHPQGKKLVIYDSEIKQMEGMSDNVSRTSAMQNEYEQFDSDVNIEVKRTIEGTPNINLRELARMSDDYCSDLSVSNARSGDSGLAKRKKVEKASVIKVDREASSLGASSFEKDMNSSVSSVNINQSVLAGMDSDVSVDFRKKKARK